MSSIRYIVGLLLVVGGVMGISATSWAQESRGVDNVINQAEFTGEGSLRVSGVISPDNNINDKVYLQALLSDSEGITRDRVLLNQAVGYNTPYAKEFKFALAPVLSDQIMLMTVTRDGVPLDIDPVRIDNWGAGVVQSREAGMLDIISCEYDAGAQILNCDFLGDDTLFAATVRLYKGQPYENKLISETSEQTQIVEDKMVLQAFEKQPRDGLYAYTISNNEGVMLHQGSVRVGAVPIEGLRSADDIAREATMKFMLQMGGLLLGFVMLVVIASQWLVGRGVQRYIWTTIGLVVLSLLGYWYFAEADSYQSTNYPQYTYTYSVEPVQDDEYYIYYSAFDSFTGTAPLTQEVEITFDGVNYQPLIQSYTGEPAHARSITVTEEQAPTTAIRIVNGCGSYYGFSEMGSDVYGTYNCEPYLLFLKDESVIGCMDPQATNYNENAVVSDESCSYTGCTNPQALNYDERAIIDDDSCQIAGCTTSIADNYNPEANVDDGSCVCEGEECVVVYGCTNPLADNYAQEANTDDNSCTFEEEEEPIPGCTDASAKNYNPEATASTDTCEYRDPTDDDILGCTDSRADNYNPQATYDNGSCNYTVGDPTGGDPVAGCTNPYADNYDPQATVNDGSCSSCIWTPMIPDPSTFCTTEVYYQTNSCTGERRNVQGLLTDSWQPNVSAADVCVGYSVTQTQQCSGLSVPPTRVIEGTSTGPFCIIPDTSFEVSTNLNTWASCDALGRIQMSRSDQVLYVRPVGTEPANSWLVRQMAGEVEGSVSLYKEQVWQIDFDYLVEKKNYSDVLITMSSAAGNNATQSCDLSLLNFEFEER